MIIQTYALNQFADEQLTYVIVVSKHEGEWIFVRHKERTTWEIPAGHIEVGESALEAANRELFEETGALLYAIQPLFDYSAYSATQEIRCGRVYFAKITQLGPLPESEIGEVAQFDQLPDILTYPHIQIKLWDEAMKHIAGL